MGVSRNPGDKARSGDADDGLFVALELPLEQGLRLERRLFQSLFATQDQKEGEYV